MCREIHGNRFSFQSVRLRKYIPCICNNQAVFKTYHAPAIIFVLSRHLSPSKRLIVNVITSKQTCSRALEMANELFLLFDERGSKRPQLTFSLQIFQSEKVKFSNFLEFIIKRLIEFTQIFCNRFVADQSFQICLHRCHVDHCSTILLLQ